jgi:hypothetical protein
VRDVIYTPNGLLPILRWDRERGVTSEPKAESGLSSSHQKHSHISFYRDSEKRDKTALFVGYLEAGMITAQVTERWRPTVNPDGSSNGVLRALADRRAPIVQRVGASDEIVTVAEVRTIAGADGNFRLVQTTDRTVLYMLRSDWVSLGFVVRPTSVSVNGTEVFRG